jgi:hypothetical protein
MTETERRNKLVNGVVALTNWLQYHPEIPMPEDISLIAGEARAFHSKWNYEFYPEEEIENESQEDKHKRQSEAARQWISSIAKAVIGTGVEIKKNYISDQFRLQVKGEGFSYTFAVERASICTRVVKDTIIHPAVEVPAHTQPERTEEVVEWVCNDGSLLADNS